MIKLRYVIMGIFLFCQLYPFGLESSEKMKRPNPDDYLIKCFNVTITMYNPIREQCDATPNITADGTKINPRRASSYRYVALSRDLLSRWGGPFEYGDYVIIEGTIEHDGIYQVRDTMNPKWIKRVDILKTFGSKQFKYTNVKICRYDEIYK